MTGDKPADPDALTTGLLRWYDRRRRALPWRAPAGRTADPYRVWLSEVMLQQTTVAAAAPYYRAFVARWPSVAALAAADADEVLRAWAGLGYYARARNLHRCAREVTARHGGRFPASEAALRALPGIGPYTAAAVAAIAFDLPATPVDGNVERVMARLHGVTEPLPGARRRLARLAAAHMPGPRPGDTAQAMMDLGATVCTPRRPDCGVCPWAGACAARARGVAAALPVRAPRPPRPLRHGVAFWAVRRDGAILLSRRPADGLLGGMMEVPGTAWEDAPPRNPPEQAPFAADWRLLPGTVRHAFTHFRLELAVMTARAPPRAAVRGRWVAPDDLAGEALPSVMRKVARHALARR